MTFKKRIKKLLLVFLIFVILCSTIQPIVAENNTSGIDFNEDANIGNISEFNDGNYFYQEIKLISEVEEDNALIHIWLPFPLNYSRDFESYRFYDKDGKLLQFHVFNVTTTSSSVSLRLNITFGDNIIYFTGGNATLEDVSTTEVYDYYNFVPNLTIDETFNTENFNFIQFSTNKTNLAWSTDGNFTLLNSSDSSNYQRYYIRNNRDNAWAIRYYWDNLSYYQTPQYPGNPDNSTPISTFFSADNIDEENGTELNIIGRRYTNYQGRINLINYTIKNESTTLSDFNQLHITRGNASAYSSNLSIASGIYTPVIVSFSDVKINDNISGVFIEVVDGGDGENLNLSTKAKNNTPLAGTYVATPQPYSYRQLDFTSIDYSSLSVNQSGQNVTYHYTDSIDDMNMTSVVYVSDIKRNIPMEVKINLRSSNYSSAPASNRYTILIPDSVNYIKLPATTLITASRTGIYGQIIDPLGNPVDGVKISYYNENGSLINFSYSTPGGMFGYSGLAQQYTYLLKFEKEGYLPNSIYATTGTINNSAFAGNIILNKLYNISITVKDADTLETITSFTTFLGQTQAIKSTDNGTVIYKNITSGDNEIIIQADGYSQVTRSIYVGEGNTDFILYVSKTDPSYYEPHVAQFAVRENNTGQLLKGVNVSVYSEDNRIASQTTGDDGTVSFKLAKYTTYKFIFSDTEREIYKEMNVTPANYLYVIYVNTNKDQQVFDYNYNRYIAFSEIESVYDPEKINSIGFDSENTAAAVRYSVYNHKNDNKMTENTVIQFIDKNKNEINITADLIVKDNSTTHYYIKIPAGTAIESGSLYKFKTVAFHEEAKDSPITLTKEWKVTYSSIKDGFNIFPGYETYYTYIAVAVLLIVVGALASFQTTSVTVLISFMATLFFVWTGWLNLPVSAIVFLFLAFLIYIFKKVHQGGD